MKTVLFDLSYMGSGMRHRLYEAMKEATHNDYMHLAETCASWKEHGHDGIYYDQMVGWRDAVHKIGSIIMSFGFRDRTPECLLELDLTALSNGSQWAIFEKMKKCLMSMAERIVDDLKYIDKAHGHEPESGTRKEMRRWVKECHMIYNQCSALQIQIDKKNIVLELGGYYSLRERI